MRNKSNIAKTVDAGKPTGMAKDKKVAAAAKRDVAAPEPEQDSPSLAASEPTDTASMAAAITAAFLAPPPKPKPRKVTKTEVALRTMMHPKGATIEMLMNAPGWQAHSVRGRGNLYHLLSNPLYVGKIKHRDKLYAGEHAAIIDTEVFAEAQALLKNQCVPRRSGMNTDGTHLLIGLVFDEAGQKLRATHANKQGKRYGYYVSKRFVEERGNSTGWRLPAAQLDGAIIRALQSTLANQAKLSEWLGDGVDAVGLQQAIRTAGRLRAEWDAKSADELRTAIRSIVSRVELRAGAFVVKIDREALASVLTGRDPQHGAAHENDRIISIEHPMSLRRRGVETRMQLGNDNRNADAPDANLIRLVGRAHRYLAQLTDGSARGLSDIAEATQVDLSDVSRVLPLAFLSPKIVEAILSGRQPVELTTQRLSRLADLPLAWTEQETLLGL